MVMKMVLVRHAPRLGRFRGRIRLHCCRPLLRLLRLVQFVLVPACRTDLEQSDRLADESDGPPVFVGPCERWTAC